MSKWMALLVFLLASVLPFGLAIEADEFSIDIENAWIPAAPPGIAVHAGYFTLENHSARAINIIGFESPGYESVSLHSSNIQNGQMEMRELASLKINPDKIVHLEPGAMHLMLYSPKESPVIGQRIPVTIITEGNGRRSFELVVKKWQ